ncbi:MAG TPA: hypothetical protein V6D03_15225 [Candidatus Caenarcaniphilales bacterium]
MGDSLGPRNAKRQASTSKLRTRCAKRRNLNAPALNFVVQALDPEATGAKNCGRDRAGLQ